MSEASARLRLRAELPASVLPRERPLIPPDSLASKRKDHTVAGLVIGGVVGFVAGWAFYNTLCEAVDNRCSDSRVPLLVLGTATGAVLGGLAGSAFDD